MGRLDETGGHNGYVVGYVPRGWVPTASGALDPGPRLAVLEHYSSAVSLRELGLLAADEEHSVRGICVVGYGCSCGWRSPYRELGQPLEWSPCIMHSSEWLADLLANKWWLPHVRAEGRRTEQLNHGHSTSDSVHVALDLPRQLAGDLLLFLDSLGDSDFARIMARRPKERAESALVALGELEDELKVLLHSGR